jgi:glucose uptake protein GlcU
MYWIVGILGLALMVASLVVVCSSNMVGLWSSFLLSAAVVIVSGIMAAKVQA